MVPVQSITGITLLSILTNVYLTQNGHFIVPYHLFLRKKWIEYLHFCKYNIQWITNIFFFFYSHELKLILRINLTISK